MEDIATLKSDRQTANIGEEIVLHINESVMIHPDGFVITFNAVPEESRCPTNVNCIWEGRAIIQLMVENRERVYETFLETPNTQQTTGQAVNLFGRTIRLVQVAPYPFENDIITPKQYRIMIRVDEWENIGVYK